MVAAFVGDIPSKGKALGSAAEDPARRPRSPGASATWMRLRSTPPRR